MLFFGKGISKRFGGLVALNNVDFELHEGEVLGLIGPNGSGKTTLFNVLTGFYKPDKGTIKYQQKDITGWRSDRICRLGIARTFQLSHLFTNLNVFENVKVGAIFGKNKLPSKDELEYNIHDTLETVNLYEKRFMPIDSLTISDMRHLELARALATKPKVLLLDEVLAGLTPVETDHLMEKIQRIKGRGVTIFMIEHIMKAIMELSDRIIVLDFGIKIAEGLPDDIVKNKRVIEAYLGTEDAS